MKIYLNKEHSLPSLFWPQFHSGTQFLVPAKNHRFLRFSILIIIIIKNFFRRFFTECTEANTTSLIPLARYHSSCDLRFYHWF